MLGLSNRSIELVQPTNKTGLSQMTGFILRLRATQNNRISEFLFWDTWAWRVVAPIDSDLINNHRRYMERNHRVAQTNPLEEDGDGFYAHFTPYPDYSKLQPSQPVG